MEPPRKPRLSTTRLYRILFLVIAILGAALAMMFYPEPRPLVHTPLPDNHVIIRITMVSENLDRVRQVHPATGINVSFYKMYHAGQPSAQDVRTRTDFEGIAQIDLYQGTYLVKISNWYQMTITVANDTSIFVRRYEIEDRPTSVKILSLSKDWKIATSDIMTLTYRNRFPYPITVESAAIDGMKGINIGCKFQQGKHNIFENCPASTSLAPQREWVDSFRAPAGISIPFSDSKKLSSFSLQVSYTEVFVNYQP